MLARCHDTRRWCGLVAAPGRRPDGPSSGAIEDLGCGSLARAGRPRRWPRGTVSRSRCRPSAPARRADAAAARTRVRSPGGKCAIEHPRVHCSVHHAVSMNSTGDGGRVRRTWRVSASRTARRLSPASSWATRSATGPNVNEAMTPGCPRRRRGVERHLGGRTGLRALAAEAVGPPERLVVDDEGLGLGSRDRARVEGSAVVGEHRVEGDLEGERRRHADHGVASRHRDVGGADLDMVVALGDGADRGCQAHRVAQGLGDALSRSARRRPPSCSPASRL